MTAITSDIVQIKPTTLAQLAVLRNEYLQSLSEPQELFMEWNARAAQAYRIHAHDIDIGYLLWSEESLPHRTLCEFHLRPAYLSSAETIFRKSIEHFAIECAYCKTFDPLLLKCCLATGAGHKVIGTLFREYRDTPSVDVSTFQIRPAIEDDITQLLTHQDELYESENELRMLVKQRNILLFLREDELIGCAFLTQVIAGRNDYDIGMWVSTPHRGKGVGKIIVGYLKQYCLEHGYRPIAGCDANNIGSRKTLQSNGFFSRYDLLCFRFDLHKTP